LLTPRKGQIDIAEGQTKSVEACRPDAKW
jgi:hypothetical protein